jgi:hypothetical protein
VIDINEPVEWRGRPAEILCADLSGSCPIAAKVTGSDGEKSVYTFTPDGYMIVGGTEENRLTNAPKRTVRYQAIYNDEGLDSLEEAKSTWGNAAGYERRTFENGKCIAVEIVS